ncbi:PAS domain-containing hybrid sensor histidine kinase/response regulator [Haliangium sp.]|uniref:PAS domain-containing hybrid sensor histidine kinase/response regulator n=1 Tax=Haliangium sp. TaxID=2663208 RepID=UPI003D0D0892
MPPRTMDDEAKTQDALIAELGELRDRLRASEERYRALLDTYSDAVMVFDYDSGLGLEQSPRAEQLFGYSDVEFAHLQVTDLVPSGERAEMSVMATQLLATGRSRRPRMRFRRVDGSEFWGDISVSIFDVEGQRRTLDIIRDVTPTVEHEERLRRHKELLQSVFDHIPVLVILFESGGRARYINREAEVVLGWTLQEWQAGGVLEACLPDAEARARVEELLVKTPSRWIEVESRTRYGRDLDTMWYGAALPSGGTLAIAQDVTARKAAARDVQLLEDRLRRKQKLEALGTLAAGVAHEINNPLTWLMGNVEYLKELLAEQAGTLPSAFAEELGELAFEMYDGTDRIRRVVAGLKPFTRVDNESVGAVDLEAVLESAIDIAGNEIRHRARLVREIERLPPVHGNEARLTQVFVNLLVNAAQAISHGHASDNEIRIRAFRAGDTMVRVSISDTGCGIQAPVLERIFEPFFTTRAPERTGLGLSICHSVVESSGGEIEVDSAPGEGSVFHVLLRMSTERLPQTQVPTPETSAVRGARILVVDDEPSVCQVIRRALRDHQVDVTEGGREALARLVIDDYDLILCDIMMPDMSGIEVFDEVQATMPAVAERFVFMTGGAFTEEARAFLANRERITLQKPLEITGLRALVVERVRARDGHGALLAGDADADTADDDDRVVPPVEPAADSPGEEAS